MLAKRGIYRQKPDFYTHELRKDVISVKFKIHECANFEQCFRKLKFWLVLILISARSRAGISDANKT